MKSFSVIFLMAAVFIACSHRASQTGGTETMETTDSTAIADQSAIDFETVSFEKSDSTAEVSLLIHWPVKGDKDIVDSLRKHICVLLDDDLDKFFEELMAEK